MPSPNRSNGANALSNYTYTTYRLSDGAVVGSGTGTFGSCEVFRDIYTTTSTRTPGFRSLKRWQLPINNYNKHFLYMNAPLGSWTRKVRPPGGSETIQVGSFRVPLMVSPYRDPALSAEDPTQRLYGKLRAAINETKAEAGVSMGELNKTATHVAHSAQRIVNALASLRTGRYGDFANALGLTVHKDRLERFKKGWKRAYAFDLNRKVPTGRFYRARNESRLTDFCADTWLEYQYGWKPLYKEIYGLAEATASTLIERQRVLRTVTATVKYSRHESLAKAAADTAAFIKSSSYKKYQIGVRYRIPNGVISPAVAFGLNNPAAIAWELVPFSFVVDWFLPIGDLINSLTDFSGLEFHDGWISGYHRHDWNIRMSPGNAYSSGGVSYTTLGVSGASEATEFDFSRTKLTSFPAFPFPEFKDPRSFAHAASAIALLQSLFLRK